MKTLIFASAALVTIAGPTRGQVLGAGREEPVAHHAAYLELIGAGGYYSFNLERITRSSTLFRFGATAGAFTDADNVTNGENALLATVGRIFRVSLPGGERDSPIEIGGGLVLGKQWLDHGSEHEDGPHAALVGGLGLRRKHEGPGFLWRLTFTPRFNFTEYSNVMKKGYDPSVGGSIGWVF